MRKLIPGLIKRMACIFPLLVIISNASFGRQINKLPEHLHGNWFLKSDCNEWVVGFYDKLIYFNNQLWPYKVVNTTGQKTQILLQKGKRNGTLTVVATNNSAISLATNNGLRVLTNVRKRMATVNSNSIFNEGTGVRGPAWIRGFVDHKYLTQTTTLQVTTRDVYIGNSEVHSAQVKEDGQFSLYIPEGTISPRAIIRFGSVFETFMLRPKDTVMLYFDLKAYEWANTDKEFGDVDPKTVFGGTIGGFNNELRNYEMFGKKKDDHEEQNTFVRTSSENQYKNYELKRKRMADSMLIAYKAKYTMSNNVQELIEQTNNYRLSNALLRYGMLHNSPSTTRLSADYIEFANSYINNSPNCYLGNYEFSGFVNEVRNLMVTKYFNDRKIVEDFIDSIFSFENSLDYAVKYNKALTDEDVDKMNKLKRYAKDVKRINGRISLEIPVKDSTEIKDVNLLATSVLKTLNDSDYDLYYATTLELMFRLNQIDTLYTKGNFRDYLLANYIYTYFLEKPRLILDDMLLERISAMFFNNAAYTAIVKKHELASQHLNIDKYENLLDIKHLKKLTVLNQIARKNIGKVVFVDFWATWCSPCIEQFTYCNNLKTYFQGKPVVFVYVCGNSTKIQWESSKKKHKLTGQNLLVSSDEISQVQAKYKFSGYPRYMMINKKGKLVSTNSAPPQQQKILIPMIENLLRR